MIRICVSIPVTTMAAAIEMIHCSINPDLLELRIDYALESISFKKLRNIISIPIIVTARLSSHGGRWSGGEDERQRLLISAAQASFDYVDVEADSVNLYKLVKKIHARGALAIISQHYMDRTPSLDEILAVHESAKKADADVVKVVGMAKSSADNMPYLEYHIKEPGNISFAMGPYGLPSRIISPMMGGAWTYASVSDGQYVASGQPTLQSLKEVYRLMGASM